MKTLMKQLTTGAILAFLFLAGSVKANGTERVASGHEIIETKLQLEEWMTDESIWDTSSDYVAEFTAETETELNLENWMTNDLIWNNTTMENLATETELEIESWMTDENVWNIYETAVEEELTLESWMTDSKIWK